MQNPTTEKKKTGYLNKNFQLFHIKDQVEKEFEFHYHDFNKIVFFLSGKVTYLIEGKSYFLKPGDILFVKQFDIHKPLIQSDVPYERIVLYIRTDYMDSLNDDICDISTCFQKIKERNFHLVRLSPTSLGSLKDTLIQLEVSLKSKAFGSSLLSKALFMQLMVSINRIVLEKDYIEDYSSLKYDLQMEELLSYINTHLRDNLSVDALSERFFLSKHHLMRKFKAKTGYTVHNYITQKRLHLANSYISQGMGIQKAAFESGFQDYTTFSRAYKKHFLHAPTDV